MKLLLTRWYLLQCDIARDLDTVTHADYSVDFEWYIRTYICETHSVY